MCRSIKTLHNFDPQATDDEIRACSLQFVRKLSGLASIALAAEDAETVDRHYQRAVAAGAEIIRPIHDARTPAFPDGSHQFDVRDPEGNLWTVGTFQPRFPAGGR